MDDIEETLLQEIAAPTSNPGDASFLKKLKKLKKKLSQTLIEELDAMDEDQLRRRIVMSETNLHDTDQARQNDEDLVALKEKAKNAEAPYKETKAHQTAIIQYCVILLQQKGKA